MYLVALSSSIPLTYKSLFILSPTSIETGIIQLNNDLTTHNLLKGCGQRGHYDIIVTCLQERVGKNNGVAC